MAEAVVDIVGRMDGYRAAVGTMPEVTDRAATSAASRMTGRIEAGVKRVEQSVSGLGRRMTAAIGGMITLEMVKRVGQLAASTREWAKELEPFRSEGLVGPNTLDEITAAADGLRAVQSVGKAAAVALAEELAPSLREGARYTVALGLAAVDAFRKFSEGKDVLHELAVWMTTGLVKAILAPATGLAELVGLMARLADVTGMDGLAGSLRTATEGYDDFAKSIADTAVGSWAKEGKAQVDSLTGGMDGYLARADRVISKESQLRAAREAGKGSKGKSTAEAAKEEGRALQELEAIRSKATEDTLTDQERVWGGLRRELAAIEAKAQAYADSAAVQGAAEAARVAAVGAATREIQRIEEAALQEQEKQRQSAWEAERQRREEAAAEEQRIAEARVAFVGDMTGRLQAMAETRAEQGKADAKAAAGFAKALAVFQIGLDAAKAFSANVAAFPLPFGPIAGAIAAGIVAAQGAIAESSQPSFFKGSEVLSRDQSVQAHAGEMILSNRETQQFAPIVQAARQGADIAPSYTWEVDRRVLADGVADDTRSGGRMSEEITRRAGRLGRRDG